MNEDPIITTAEERLGKAYFGEGVVSIDPAIISFLLALLQKLISGCFAAGADGASIKSRRPIIVSMVVWGKLLMMPNHPGDARKIVKSVVATWEQSTAAEIDQMGAVA